MRFDSKVESIRLATPQSVHDNMKFHAMGPVQLKYIGIILPNLVTVSPIPCVSKTLGFVRILVLAKLLGC